MAPRSRRIRPAKRFKACKERQNRICELPDEILVSVLSLLTMKEAGKTSVLSKRWRHMWTHIPTLDFDSGELINDVLLQTKSREEEVPKYLYWVDQVVSSHKAPTLDEFRVRFYINGNNRNSIDSWVRFAVEKRVKRLAIDLSVCHRVVRRSCCTFPSLLLGNSLTSLEFASVNISSEVIESLLSSCLALENLSVSHSDSTVGLKISGPSLSLKCLRIHQCWNIKQLEISAPNLVSLFYGGPETYVHLISTPKLVKISFSDEYALDFVRAFSDLGCYLSQVEVLNLKLCFGFRRVKEPVEYPVFERLKKLDVRAITFQDISLFFLVSLITACPLLHHFKLLFEGDCTQRRKLRKHKVYPHYNLKIVEIVGFVGRALDLEFAEHLMKAAPSLEKFIVDTRVVSLIGTPLEFKVTSQMRRARLRAERLRPFLKAGTDLLIQ